MTVQPTKKSKGKKAPEKSSPPSNIVKNSNKFGTIKINENVIIDVIKKATCSVEGVTKLSGGKFVDSIASIMGSQRTSDHGISIDIKNDTVSVDVKVNVLYGENIPEIAADVQNTIFSAVKQIIGLNVVKVNVMVQGIEHPSEIEETE